MWLLIVEVILKTATDFGVALIVSSHIMVAILIVATRICNTWNEFFNRREKKSWRCVVIDRREMEKREGCCAVLKMVQ